MTMSSELTGLNGKLIAFEGCSELVSIQLHLLPPSAHIMVLPSLQHYLSDLDKADQASSDPRHIIRQIHRASQARHSAAMDFLRHSTSDQERIVIMNGGTAGAQALCISAISSKLTNGDVEKAVQIFNEIVRHGVTNLSGETEAEVTVKSDNPPSPSAQISQRKRRRLDSKNRVSIHDQDEDDLLSRAACESADPITRAMRAADALDRETESLHPPNHDVDLTEMPASRARSLSLSAVEDIDKQHARETLLTPSVYTTAASALASDSHGQSSSGRNSRERSQLVSWYSAPPQGQLKKSKSFEPVCVYNDGDPGMATLVPQFDLSKQSSVNSMNWQPKNDSRDSVVTAKCATRSGMSSRLGVPISIYSTGNERRSVNTFGGKYDNTMSLEIRLDEGSDTRNFEHESLSREELLAAGHPFEAVFPYIEDLVIYFSGGAPDEVFEIVSRDLRDSMQDNRLSLLESVASALTEEEVSLEEEQPCKERSGRPAHIFYELNGDQKTAVSVQNSLRSVLSSHSTLQEWDYLSASPEKRSLWKPLVCDTEQERDSSYSGRMDLILAVGAEKTVKRDYVSTVVGRIEKLGSKSSGFSRTGRLELRYLIANAMQAFTAQPLTKQVQHNPFTNSDLLASLIIPHLDNYLTAHPDVRFLVIEYPANHLSTVLALQQLVGAKLMKVAGIFGGDSDTVQQGNGETGVTEDDCPAVTLFSQADYLLPSVANESDITSFVMSVREALVSISDFYMAEDQATDSVDKKKLDRELAVKALTANESSGSSIYSTTPGIRNNPNKSSSSQLATPPPSPADDLTSQHHGQTKETQSQRRHPLAVGQRRAGSPAPSTASTMSTSSTEEVRRGKLQRPSASKAIALDDGAAPPPPPIRMSSLNHKSKGYGMALYSNNRKHQETMIGIPASPDPDDAAPAPTVPTGSAHGSTYTTTGTELSYDYYNDYDDDDDDVARGRRGRGWMGSRDGAADEDDSMYDSFEEKRLMPMFLRTPSDVAEKRNSTKAFRWLGLA